MLRHKRCKYNITSWRVRNFNFLNARISRAIVLEQRLQGNFRRISMPNCYGKATMGFLFIAEIQLCQQYQKFVGLHVMRPIYLFDFKQKWISMPYFNKILAYEFHKVPSNGAELCHADVQTDRHDETNSSFTKTLRKRLQMHLCNKAWKSRLPQNKIFWVQRRAAVSKAWTFDNVSWPRKTAPWNCWWASGWIRTHTLQLNMRLLDLWHPVVLTFGRYQQYGAK